MKPLHILHTLLTGALLAGTVSCKKFLDQQPISQASDQTGWKSDGDANAAVAATYALMRGSFNTALNLYAYGDFPSDEFLDQASAGGDSYQDIIGMRWGINIPAVNTYDPRMKLRLYTSFYTTIAQANRCLHFISAMPLHDFTGSDDASRQAQKNRYLGEAYFLRGFNYFYMARVWGGVPLITEYTDNVAGATSVARAPEADVLAQAVSDLHQAAQLLQWKDNTSPDRVVRADKGAAFATLAHLYAWKGVYDSCRMASDSVILQGGYTLVGGSNYLDIYKGQSNESIFEIAQNNASEAQILTQSIAGYTLIQPYVTGITVPWVALNDGVVDNLYNDTTDLRLKKCFYRVTNGVTRTTVCVKYQSVKYLAVPGNSTGVGVSMNNMLIFRLADILLLKAEALAAGPQKDEAAALNIVNNIRTRAGIATPLAGLTGNNLISAITAERGRELFLEGSRFYDLVRLGRKTGIVKLPYVTTAEFQGGKYYWPVDPTLFTLNTLLTQTPFWADKIH